MVKFKLSTTILVIIFATIYAFYYIYSINVNKDINSLVSDKITQNALLVKEVIDKNKIKTESQLKEWALSNKIAEDIDDLNDYYQDKKELEEKIKKITTNKENSVVSPTKKEVVSHIKKKNVKESDIIKNKKTLEQLKEELKNLNKDIESSVVSLKNRFNSLTKTLNMNFYYLISEHLSKVEEMNSNFQTSKEFINTVKNGKTDSDIWVRKNFLYEVYGVPIKLNGKVLGSLFVGIKRTKRDADFLTNKLKSQIAYINNNKTSSTNIDNFYLKNMLNKYITNHKEDLKTLSYNDISEIFEINTKKGKYMSIFIPLKSYSVKVSGIIIVHKVSKTMISSVTKIKYWLPIFAIAMFLLVIIIIYIMNKSFLHPYIDLEIETNKFLDEEEYNIIPSEFGEAEGLARSIKRLIRKTKGEKEVVTNTWDDPLFVTELKKDDFSSKKKEKNHHDEVYDMFIRAHRNNGLPFEHIKREEFKKRLLTIENRLKNKFKVNDIYFEVLVDDSGIIKLHPQITK